MTTNVTAGSITTAAAGLALTAFLTGPVQAGPRDKKAIEIRILGDTAYDLARYTITSRAGEQLTGNHVAVLEKRDSEWIVKRTLVNAKMPAPPAQ